MIDLETVVGQEALFTLADGRQGHTHIIRNEDGTYGLRVEGGWYWHYDRHGVQHSCGKIVDPDSTATVVRDDGGNIVDVRPCKWESGMPVFRP